MIPTRFFVAEFFECIMKPKRKTNESQSLPQIKTKKRKTVCTEIALYRRFLYFKFL